MNFERLRIALISPVVIMSTLNTVVGNYHTPRWEAGRLGSDDFLLQFYDKFWGVGGRRRTRGRGR
jgi:hypothetical protein